MTLSIQILLPALPPLTSPARLSRWCVAVGQQVTAGEVIAKIDTGQSTIEVESTVSGRIERILVPEDTWGMPPNVAIALIAPDEYAEAEFESADGDLWQPLNVPTRSPGPAVSHAPEARPGSHAPNLRPSSPAPELRPSSAAPDFRTGSHMPERHLREPQLGPEMRPAMPQESLQPPPAFHSPPSHSRRPLAPPRARRQVTASLGAGEPEPTQRPPEPAGVPSHTPQPQAAHTQEPAARPAEIEEPVRNIPCARLTIDCGIGGLARLRPEHQAADLDSGFILPAATSPGVVFAKALAMALADIPAANVTWTPEGLLHHRDADVAFAVLLPELQVSPVIRNADKRTLDEIALKVIDLTQRARAKVLDPGELRGAAATILDLGAYGIRTFEPVLAPPHSLSLSLGAKELRPVIIDGEIRSAPIITCTLLCDARAIPVAVAAELLATIKALVEDPRGLLLPASSVPLF